MSRLAGPVPVFLMFTGLAAVLTWPQAAHPTAIPDHVDAWFSLWRLAWFAHQLPRDPIHLFDTNIFYPAAHTLAFSDAVPAEGLAGSDDDAIYAACQTAGRTLITLDLDFANPLRFPPGDTEGIIVVRPPRARVS